MNVKIPYPYFKALSYDMADADAMAQQRASTNRELFDVMDNIQTKWANPYF